MYDISNDLREAIDSHDWFSHEQYNIFSYSGVFIGALNDIESVMKYTRNNVVVMYDTDGHAIRLSYI